MENNDLKKQLADNLHEQWFNMYEFYNNPLFKQMDNEEKRQYKRCEKTMFDIYKKVKYNSRVIQTELFD